MNFDFFPRDQDRHNWGFSPLWSGNSQRPVNNKISYVHKITTLGRLHFGYYSL